MRWQDRAPCSLTVSRDCEALLFFVRPLEKVSLSLHVEQECVKNSGSPWERGNSDKQVWFRSFLRVGNSTLLLTRAAKESLCPDNERLISRSSATCMLSFGFGVASIGGSQGSDFLKNKANIGFSVERKILE